jgi:TonB family protein
MFKKFIRKNIAWLLSSLIHLSLLLLIIFLTQEKRNVTNEIAITVNIIPPSKSDSGSEQIQQIKKSQDQHFKLEKAAHHEQSFDKKDKTDLSYSKNIYQLGSKQNPLPPYPRVARLKKFQGKVEISITFNSLGNVIEAKIHHSSGHQVLDEAALKTLKNWRFNVGDLEAKEQGVQIVVPIDFKIDF